LPVKLGMYNVQRAWASKSKRNELFIHKDIPNILESKNIIFPVQCTHQATANGSR
jgi:hypothetical protein